MFRVPDCSLRPLLSNACVQNDLQSFRLRKKKKTQFVEKNLSLKLVPSFFAGGYCHFQNEYPQMCSSHSSLSGQLRPLERAHTHPGHPQTHPSTQGGAPGDGFQAVGCDCA